TQNAFKALPPAPPADPSSDILRLVQAFMRDAEENVKDVPDEDGLLQTIRLEQDKSRVAIRHTAQHF
ncbi:hypothetical protein K525DRAFT_153515, partial [Schizophyllum commune Loenen D]